MMGDFRYPYDVAATLEPWRAPLGDEFNGVVAHLADRDRAIEDYLSNLPTGESIGDYVTCSGGWSPKLDISTGTDFLLDIVATSSVGTSIEWVPGADNVGGFDINETGVYYTMLRFEATSTSANFSFVTTLTAGPLSTDTMVQTRMWPFTNEYRGTLQTALYVEAGDRIVLSAGADKAGGGPAVDLWAASITCTKIG